MPGVLELAQIASTFGCTTDDLLTLAADAPLPKLKPADQSARYYRMVEAATPKQLAQLDAIYAEIEAERQKRIASGAPKDDPAKARIAKKR